LYFYYDCGRLSVKIDPKPHAGKVAKLKRSALVVISFLALVFLASAATATTSAEQQMQHAFGAMRLNAYKTAVKYFTLALKNKSGLELQYQITAYRLRGECYKQLRKFKNSIRDFNRAIKIAANHVGKGQLAQLYASRGTVYLAWRKKKKAVKELTKALNISPKNAYIYYLRAGAYRSMRDYPRALEDLNKALQLDKRHQFYYQRSYIHSAKKNIPKAVADMEAAVRLKPGRAAYKKRLEYLRHLQDQ
jgi:tetratricopeptide (TPR) repeat protein